MTIKLNLRSISLPAFIDIFCLVFLVSFNVLWMRPFLSLSGNIGGVVAPVIPILSRAAAFFLPISEYRAAFFLVFIGQLLGVITFYFFLKELTARRLPGLMVGYFYSLPVKFLALDRLRHAWIEGDGAHVMAVGLFPLVCYFLLTFLKKGGMFFGLLASMSVAVVGLISPFALFNLVLFLLVIAFSELILGQAKFKLLRFLFVVSLAWGMAAFWYTPGFVYKILSAGQGRLVVSLLWRLVPISFFAVPIIFVFGYLIFESREGLQPIALTLGFFTIYLFVNLVEFLSYSDFRDFLLIPHRFLPEFGLCLSLLLGVAATIFLDALGSLSAIGKIILPAEPGGNVQTVRGVAPKRGVSLLFLIFIWMVGMILVSVTVPTQEVVEEINALQVPLKLPLSLDYSRTVMDQCFGLLVSAASWMFVFFLVMKMRAKWI
ncbi:hypothetical protein B5M47_02870 [candidate division CPR3 bacterium 4484_211]|uniref:Uncharacterized protein n=1 Tax=candidate division CPR3 bacterium 4484_211 TaxID=1968527 RepID=A0A1W9NXQ9_UNCC3|nr:MAG: hypothetical protein B5M47_02870 [candidate division CPR3 bacterium 4484_211]